MKKNKPLSFRDESLSDWAQSWLMIFKINFLNFWCKMMLLRHRQSIVYQKLLEHPNDDPSVALRS